MMAAWLKRPKAALCLLIAVAALSVLQVSRARVGPSEDAARQAFAVTIRHEGVDAAEIERSITSPLEDALSAIPGRVEMRSTSEFGQARVLLFMRDSSDSSYALVRQAVERLYARMPSSVQKPEIVSSSEGSRPAWVAAVGAARLGAESLARAVEGEMKASFSKLEGAGEVESWGAGASEVRVRVDPRKLAAFGLDAGTVARVIASNDFYAPAGALREGNIELTLPLAGRLAGAEDIRKLSVPTQKGPIPLGELATVEEGAREPDTVSRVDGKLMPAISVSPGGGANLIELGRGIARERAAWEARGFSFTVVVDRCGEMEDAFSGVAQAMLQALAAVAACTPFIVRGLRPALAAMMAVPLTALLAAAILAAAGLRFDANLLTGLAIGLGTSVDAMALVIERLRAGQSPAERARAVAAVLPSMGGGALTTLIVLVPLAGLDFASAGMRETAWALGAAMVAAVIISLAFLPHFAAPAAAAAGKLEGIARALRAWASHIAGRRRTAAEPVLRLIRRARKLPGRALSLVISSAVRYPLPYIAGAALLLGAGIAMVASAPIDSGAEGAGDSISVHLEFDRSALSLAESDLRASEYALSFRAISGVRLVQASAKRGSAELEASFDPAAIGKPALAAALRALPVRGGFAYIPEVGIGSERSYEVCFTGDEDAALRGLARKAAALLAAQAGIDQAVLNFKDPPGGIAFRIDGKRAAAAGVGAGAAASLLRELVQGPVVHKRIAEGREVDVRVIGPAAPSLAELALAPLPTRGGSVPLGSVGSFVREDSPGTLFRRDRRPSASVTVRTGGLGIQGAEAAVREALAPLDLPEGYAWSFDRNAKEAEERFAGAAGGFVIALALVYAALAAITESFALPLVALAAAPAAIALPLFALLLRDGALGLASLCALVIVSGVAVNASLVVVDEARTRLRGQAARGEDPAMRPGGKGRRREGRRGIELPVFLSARSRTGALAATTVTAIAGSLPLLVQGGAGFQSALALATCLGTAAAYLATITMVPAAISFFGKRLFK